MADETLPSRIGASDLIDFIEKVVYHPGSSENDIKMRIQNAGEIASLKRAALIFHLIDEEAGIIHPNDLSKRFAFADQAERKRMMLYEIILSFDMYSIPLEHIVGERTEPFSMTSSDFQKYWTVNRGLKLSKDVLDRSATTLYKLLEFSGIGQYYIGRRGKPTRLELTGEGLELLRKAFDLLNNQKKQNALNGPISGESINQRNMADMGAPVTEIQKRIEETNTNSTPSTIQYQTHTSKDGSVILKIVPSKKAIKFLELIIPILRLEIEEEDE